MLFSKFLSNRPGSTVPKPVESFAGHSAPFALKRLAFAVLFACAVGSTVTMPTQAYAAGLGRLNVQSGLGQPLHAEVEVTSATPEELQSLQVKLASTEAFKQAGIDVNPALLGISLAIEQRGSRAIVRMTTVQPLNEPYVDLLLELSWANGRLVREYTFLLDPPELKLGRGNEPVQPAVGATPRPAAPVAQQPKPIPQPVPAAESPAAPRTAGRGKPAPAPTPKPEAQAGEYVVKRGDTLGKVADQLRPDGVTLDQMLVSLFRNNPDAFAGNMNRMKTGAVLRTPDAAEAASVSGAEARKIVSAQTADFAAYRSRLASGVAAGAAKAAPGDERSASGQVTAKVEDQAGTKPSGDQVKLARPQDATAKSGATPGAAGAARADEIAAKDKALTEARQRIAELERNVTDLRGLVAAQNKVGADAQKAAETKKAEDAKKAADEAKKAEDAKKAAEEAKKAEDARKAAEAAGAADKAKVVDANKPAETPAATTPPAQAPAAEAPKPAEPVKPAVPPTPAPVQPVAEEEPWFTNPIILGGGAAVLALIGVYVAYSRSRKKRFEKFQDSILTGGDLKTNSIFGTTGGQTVDTTDSTFNSNFTPSASQIDSNEVDPIAEADVYIAYGRDAQAEEILKEALKNSPDRHAIRVKLLEIYASRRDLPAFESVAGELYSRTGGQGDDWEKAATLGRSLDPRNPLYGGSSDAITATATGVGALAAGGAFVDTNATVPVSSVPTGPSVDVDFDLDLDLDPDPDHQQPLSESTPVDFELGQAPHDDFLNRTTPSMEFSPTVPVPRGAVRTRARTHRAPSRARQPRFRSRPARSHRTGRAAEL